MSCRHLYVSSISSWLRAKSLLKPILKCLAGSSFPARGYSEKRKWVNGTRCPVASYYCRLELGIQQGSPYKCKTVRGSLCLLPSLKSFFKMSCFPPLCFNIGPHVPWDLRGMNSHCKLLTFVPWCQVVLLETETGLKAGPWTQNIPGLVWMHSCCRQQA